MNYRVSGFAAPNLHHSQITEEQYISIKSAKRTCLFALELEEKYALLLDNFYELETELLKLAESFRIWPPREHRNMMRERLTLDRRVVNLLTACRLYLDQTDHGLSELFGNPSSELSDVKAFKNQLYDAHLGYRFMEALRNHVQHAGLPVHIIGYDYNIVSTKDGDYREFSISPQCSFEKLEENTSFKKLVLDQLKELPNPIDMRPFIRRYVSCFAEIHSKLRQIISAKYSTARTHYENSMASYASINSTEVKFVHIEMHEDSGTQIERIALVTEFLGHIDVYRQTNLDNMNFVSSFSSNLDQEIQG